MRVDTVGTQDRITSRAVGGWLYTYVVVTMYAKGDGDVTAV